MTLKKYLHIVPDNKFIGAFICDVRGVSTLCDHQFVAFNRYDPLLEKFEYLDPDVVIYAPPGTRAFVESVGPLERYEKVFIHWFLPELESFIRTIPKGPMVYWCFWGEFDASLGPLSRRLRYGRASRRYVAAADLLSGVTNPAPRRFPWIRGPARSLIASFVSGVRWLSRARSVARVDVLLHWNDIDHLLLKKLSLHRSMARKEFFYNVIDSEAATRSAIVDGLWRDRALDGCKVVMLGHSSFPSGNHLDAMDRLACHADDAALRVIAVLSYGDPIYREVVKERGRRLFGSRFIAVSEFMPVADYYYLTQKVSAAVLNHHLSEGAGNIFRLLRDGKKVFLSSRSTIYKMLKRDGVAIFDIDTDLGVDSISPISDADVERNRLYIATKFGDDAARSNMERIFRT